MRIQLAPWFRPFTYPVQFKSLAGGRGSGKSQQMARFAVMRMAQLFSNPDLIGKIMPDGMPYPYYPPGPIRIMSGRQHNVSLNQSVKIVMDQFIQASGLFDQFQILQGEIRHRQSGSVCFFQGIERNLNDILSMDAVDVWWFEQAEFLTEEQMRLIIPTARHYARCPVTGKMYVNEKWFVWNPKYRTDWCWVRFVENPRDTDLHLHVNYDSNPWLPPNLLEEAEYDKRDWPEAYQHTWLGQPDDTDAKAKMLTFDLVQSCFDGWDKRPDLAGNMRTDMGLDIALGGRDSCCAVVRTGPVVHSIDTWRGEQDLNAIAAQATHILKREAKLNNVEPLRIYFDGAHPMMGAFNHVKPPSAYEAVLFGGAVQGKSTMWESRTTNGDYFAMRNIQMATNLRMRAERTRKLIDGQDIDNWGCLFFNPEIGDRNRLVSMLTQPTRRINSSGRWVLEKDAGDPVAKSPDEFDALCLAFAHDSRNGLRARD